MNKNINVDMKNKKVLICGMAKSGVSAAFLANEKGAKVVIQDIKEKEAMGDVSYIESKGIEIFAGKNPDEIIKDMDLVIVSPGIPTSLPFFQIAKENGVKIISEIEFSYYFTKCPIIAITGTNGKTTTTALVGEIIKKKYNNSVVVGNIGNPYSKEVSKINENDYVVAEISSFQMETSYDFHPHISAILNIAPDHLDRHKTLDCYIEMKERVYKNQTENDFLILNYSDEVTKNMTSKAKSKVFYFSSCEKLESGIYLDNKDIIVKWNNIDEKIISVNELNILGVHNHENVMAAIAMGICAGVEIQLIVEALKEFKGVEHRIEFVETVNGVDYYNDSKATNVDAAIKGIKAMNKPCVLIGGGYDKASEFDDWVKEFEGKVKHLVLIGVTAPKIQECCEKYGFSKISFGKDFKEAINLCKEIAVEGDCVLLSPACASWDMFSSYEERGNIFKELVKEF